MAQLIILHRLDRDIRGELHHPVWCRMDPQERSRDTNDEDVHGQWVD